MSAPSDKSYRAILWVLVLVGVTSDQVSKYGVFKWLYPGAPTRNYDVIPGVLELVAQFSKEPVPANALADLRSISGPVLPHVNEGALFGLGQEYKTVANTLFTLISIAAAAAMIYWSTRKATARDPALCIALGLILAGTLGNLYDRVVFFGVRDFLHFSWLLHFCGKDFPIFNVADCCLVCGAILLLVQAFLHRPAPVPEQTRSVAFSAGNSAAEYS